LNTISKIIKNARTWEDIMAVVRFSLIAFIVMFNNPGFLDILTAIRSLQAFTAWVKREWA
jgi:hypothetical protein